MLRDNEVRVHELNYLFWECTTRCNFHCRHCGSDCGIAERGKDMPLEDFLAAVDTIPKERIPKNFTVVLTGGEPLLRPDILEIGKELRSRGLQWGIVSNGWLYDDEMHPPTRAPIKISANTMSSWMRIKVVAIEVNDKIALVIFSVAKIEIIFSTVFAKTELIFAKYETIHYFCKNNKLQEPSNDENLYLGRGFKHAAQRLSLWRQCVGGKC